MTTPNLAQRLVAASGEMGWIEKAGTNTAQKYDYTRAVDVFARVRDILNKHGILWMFSTRDHDITVLDNGRYLHKLSGDYSYTNMDDPSQVYTGTVEGSTVANGDKGAWVATTGLLKYALIQSLLLPTGDDPEADENEPRKPHAVAPTIPVPTRAEKAPVAEHTGLTDKQIAKLKITLRENGLTVTDSQRFVLNKLVGKQSSKQMTNDDLDKVLAFFAEKTDEVDDLVLRAMASVSG